LSIFVAVYFLFARSRQNSRTSDMRSSNSLTTSEPKHWSHALNVRSNSSAA
jgi:hypothetical protein